MAHGGKRERAGRKQGSLTIRTRKIAERAVAEGKAPLEVMLENMRHFQQLAIDAESVLAELSAEDFVGPHVDPKEQFKALLAEVKKAAGLRQMAQECARDAANYMHPRLSSHEMKAETTIHYVARVPEKDATSDQWQARNANKLNASGNRSPVPKLN